MIFRGSHIIVHVITARLMIVYRGKSLSLAISKNCIGTVEIKPEICKGSSKIYFDWLMWKSMSELSENIEKLGPAHAILRG